LINKDWEINVPEINQLLEKANLRLGELNAFAIILPDVDTFIKMHIVKEATLSSRIEGTRTSIDEALMAEKDIDPELKNDWQEVQNYIEAMNFSIKRLNKLPLSARLLREAHKLLMKGVRGKHKMPGEFRKSQNWIGGATLKDAKFIPPAHTFIADLMTDLEKFLNNEELHVPHLIKIGIAHYQFEAIHPFLDGNGRIGRLLITLYLVERNILNKPTLYFSDFIERNRQHYYANLSAVSNKGELVHWLKFFLIGVIETAETAISTFNKILLLRTKLESKAIIKLGKKIPKAQQLLAYLFRQPVVNVNDIISHLNVTKPTANALIADFVKLKILKEQTGFKRNRSFHFEAYLKLFGK
jgi:Fic family protein